MKRLTIAFALLAVLCLASVALAADAPNLVGTWEGAPSVHEVKGGYHTGKLVLTVTEQHGTAFHGTKTYRLAALKKDRTEGFSGTISSNGQIFIADHDEGFMLGTLTKDGMELQYGHAGKNAAAVQVLLKKK